MASAYAGMRCCRMISRPLCAAVGVLVPENASKVAVNSLEASVEDLTDTPHCWILVADADDSSADAALLEVSPADDVAFEAWSAASREVPFGVEWLNGPGKLIWHVKAASGEPLRGDSGAELAAASGAVLSEADVTSAELAAIVLVGAAGDGQEVSGALCKRVLRAQPGDVAKGLAVILAAEAGEPGASLCVSELLAHDIGVLFYSPRQMRKWKTNTSTSDGTPIPDDVPINTEVEDIDILFERGKSLPAKTKRTLFYDDWCGEDACLAMVQRDPDGFWRKCRLQQNVFADSSGTLCENVEVSFTVDSSGTIVLQLSQGKPVRHWRRYIYIFILIVICLGLIVTHPAGARAILKARQQRLQRNSGGWVPESHEELFQYARTLVHGGDTEL